MFTQLIKYITQLAMSQPHRSQPHTSCVMCHVSCMHVSTQYNVTLPRQVDNMCAVTGISGVFLGQLRQALSVLLQHLLHAYMHICIYADMYLYIFVCVTRAHISRKIKQTIRQTGSRQTRRHVSQASNQQSSPVIISYISEVPTSTPPPPPNHSSPSSLTPHPSSIIPLIIIIILILILPGGAHTTPSRWSCLEGSDPTHRCTLGCVDTR